MVAPDLNDLSAWQYNLPDHLIASRPAARRDDSRLMVIRRDSAEIEHRLMRELPDLLQSGDRLVFNNTKVLPARLFGFRTSTGGRWEGLFLEQLSDGRWRITGQTRGRLQAGESLTLIGPEDFQSAANPPDPDAADVLPLHLVERCDDGSWIAVPGRQKPVLQLLEDYGTLPLPPYIGRKVADNEDRQRYQTVFASEAGAIAAPTAGLHFSQELLEGCAVRQISGSEVTLHVGIGTFRPISVEKLSEHAIHSEWCRVSATVAADVASTKVAGGSVVAVGTTCVRTLEAASAGESLSAWEGPTDLFIRPGFRFAVVDQLLTNFHLPGSTLIVLVAALAGYDLTMEAYRRAVEAEYRFYSYGDAMLIL